MMKTVDYVVNHQKEVLDFLKSRFPMYHLSNFFFRDVQYGVQMMLAEKGLRVRYSESEKAARALVEKLEHAKIFRSIDHQSWVVNYPEFKTPVSRAAAPAKPAAPAPAAPRSAASAPPRPAGEASAGIPPSQGGSGS